MPVNRKIEMKYSETSRIEYIEPTMIAHKESDVIPYPYEDYTIYVDLEVKDRNRYNCGIPGNISYIISTENGTLNLMSGTDGELTTNYTESKQVGNEAKFNTTECVGVESIEISYDKNFIPQVNMKIIDVRGLSFFTIQEEVMKRSQSEGKHYNLGQSFLKRIFSLPPADFFLTVKGFYGKSVKFQLIVSDIKVAFNDATGNFEVNVKFIGKLFGIYVDLPLLYILIAPYLTYNGSNYWNDSIDNGNFVFQEYGRDIPTFLEYKRLIEDPENGLGKDSDEETNKSEGNPSTDKINALSIKNSYEHFKDILIEYAGPGEHKFLPGLNKTSDGFIYDFVRVGTVIGNYSSLDKKFNEASDKIKKEIAKISTISAPPIISDPKEGSRRIVFDVFRNNDGNYTFVKNNTIGFNKDNGKYNFDIDIDSFSINNNYHLSINKINSPDSGEEFVCNYLRSVKNNIAKIEVFLANTQLFEQKIDEKISTFDNKIKEKDAEERREAIVKPLEILGFIPTVKNIFKIIFAHIDTFTSSFYSMLENINSSRTERTLENYGINKSNTDLPDCTKETFIPPFPGLFKENKSDGVEEYVRPGEMCGNRAFNSENFEELKFVDALYDAAKQYQEYLKEIEEMSANAANTSLYDFEYIPSIDTDIIDIMTNGFPKNPYSEILNKSSKIDEAIENIFTLFATRYYIFNSEFDYKKPNKMDNKGLGGLDLSIAFSNIEAANLFKALKKNQGNDLVKKIIEKIKNIKNDSSVGEDAKDQDGKDTLIYDLIQEASIDNEKEDKYSWNIEGAKKMFDNDGEKIVFKWFKNTISDIEEKEDQDTDTEKGKDLYFIPLRAEKVICKPGEVSGDVSLIENNGSNWICSDLEHLDICENNFYFFKSISQSTIQGIYENDICFQREKDRKFFFKLIDDVVSMPDLTKSELKLKTVNFGLPYDVLDYYGYSKYYDIYGNSIDLSLTSIFNTVYIFDSEEKDFFHDPTIFSHEIYKDTSSDVDLMKNIDDVQMAQAYLFIMGFPIQGLCEVYSEGNDGGFMFLDGKRVLVSLLQEGAIYWRYKFMEENNGKDPIKWPDKMANPKEDEIPKVEFGYIFYISNTDSTEYMKINIPENETRKNSLISFFKEWSVGEGSSFGIIKDELDNKDKHDANFRPIKVKKMQYDYMLREGEVTDEEISKYKNDDEEFHALPGNFEKYKEVLRLDSSIQSILSELLHSTYDVYDFNHSLMKKKNSKFRNFSHVFFEHGMKIASFNSDFKRFFKSSKDFIEKYEEEKERQEKEEAKTPKCKEEPNPDEEEIAREIKLSTYLTLKSLYENHYCSESPERWLLNRSNSDFNKIVYLDQFYNDIGDKIILNAKKVSDCLIGSLPSDPRNRFNRSEGGNVYSFISDILMDSNMSFQAFPLMNALSTGYGREHGDNIKKMFRPNVIDAPIPSSNFFWCMYNSKPSEYLDVQGLPGANKNDSFDIADSAGDISQTSVPDWVRMESGLPGHKKIPAFGVTFGKQNQSFFKNVKVNMDNFKETEYSIAAEMNVAAEASKGKREINFMGQDIYSVFSNYSYTCTVESMGNIQIMPGMLFQLNNISMFKGAYMIMNVSHKIVPGDISTTFTGVRLKRRSLPYITTTGFFIDGQGNVFSTEEDWDFFKKIYNISDAETVTDKDGNVSEVMDIDWTKTWPDLDPKEDWECFLKAEIWQESANNEKAVGDGGKAIGVLQLWEIMVREANDCKNKLKASVPDFTYEDRKSREKSIEMFNYIQDYRNKSKNKLKATKIWNPGASYEEYFMKIMKHYKKFCIEAVNKKNNGQKIPEANSDFTLP